MLVHSFESMAARDGDGLRYAVFLAGCPLRCIYCHNPDTWNMNAGTEYPLDVILKKIVRCKPYMTAGNGGVTFSGGEPLLQAKELWQLIALLKNEELGSCIDTSGCIPLTEDVKKAFLTCDSVLLDLKFASEEEYRIHTGGSLQNVLNTLSFLTQNSIPTQIRTVIVPKRNDNEDTLEQYASLLKPFKDSVSRWELLPFHTLGFAKYEKLLIPNPLLDTAVLPHETLADLQKKADQLLFNFTT